jgi:hypothetical protein
MSNDVQSHEDVAERVAGEERRASVRHAARSLGSVTARIIGGSQVDLVNFSNRGVLFECDSRLLIGARTSVRITTADENIIISGRVVRSRVKGLVNGALRYDAALVLDAELGLVPRFLDVAIASDAGSDADVLDALESDLDATFDPSPVEAYLAESEASLLEVAHGADVPLNGHAFEPAFDADPDVAAEPPPIPALAEPAIEVAEIQAADIEVSAEPEPIAFEADAEIAFEPAVEFAFDEGAEPFFDAAAPDVIEGGAAVIAIEAVEQAVRTEPASSMFDATYTPPVVDLTPVAASQFDVRLPRPALDATPSSFFDAHRSESFGEPSAEPAVAFEAEDGVMFEEASEAAPVVAAAAGDAFVDLSPDPFATSALPAAAPDDLIDPPAAVPDTEDRALLQFAATVPPDLAELRRIAADNQW